MERFFTFDNVNTWYDWKLVLTEKDVTPPTPKTNYVKLDGMSGSLDLSEALTGEITYDDRIVTASFWTSEGTRNERASLLRDITAMLHGRNVKIIEPDDPDHYFYGRVTVKSFTNILPYAELSIEATCTPWRYALNEITRVVDVNPDTPIDAIIRNSGVKTVCPIITVDGSIKLTYDERKIELNTGSYKISDILFYRGVNVVGVSGRGSVTFTYREADL